MQIYGVRSKEISCVTTKSCLGIYGPIFPYGKVLFWHHLDTYAYPVLKDHPHNLEIDRCVLEAKYEAVTYNHSELSVHSWSDSVFTKSSPSYFQINYLTQIILPKMCCTIITWNKWWSYSLLIVNSGMPGYFFTFFTTDCWRNTCHPFIKHKKFSANNVEACAFNDKTQCMDTKQGLQW